MSAPPGRWPANVILDPETAAALDQQSGYQRDGVAVNRNKDPQAEKPHAVYGGGWLNGTTEDKTYGSGGGASRFFHVADDSHPQPPNTGGSTPMPQIIHDDALTALRGMPDNSVDAVVTDPPYGLSNTTPDKVADTIVRWASGDREYTPKGRGFMGQAWDAFVPPPAVWDECLRVLRPGGHLVVFAGSRTQDLMGLSIRLAGFDIRENVAWMYGSGFPKSLDVSKAIDKARDDKADILRVTTFMADHAEAHGITRKDVDEHMGTSDMGGWWLSRLKHRCQVPKVEQWLRLKEFLNLPDDMDAEVWRLNGRKGSPGEAWGQREVVGSKKSSLGGTVAAGLRDVEYIDKHKGKVYDVTAPATPEAEKWQGWGTALKPAHEPIILARKPFPGTVAANTLEWGTGGLNIDATRVTPLTDAEVARSGKSTNGGIYGKFDSVDWKTDGKPHAGRWPANVVLDPDTAHALDQQSGTSKDGVATNRNRGERIASTVNYANHDGQDHGYGGQGGASRFFKVVEPDVPFMYAAKAPKRERPSYTDESGQQVQHPTVKPVSVIRWLVRLVTPEGGTVLDPFGGSGTTLEAALLEGMDPILIEAHGPYIPLIEARRDRVAIG